jgi:hypothetical protein
MFSKAVEQIFDSFSEELGRLMMHANELLSHSYRAWQYCDIGRV